VTTGIVIFSTNVLTKTVNSSLFITFYSFMRARTRLLATDFMDLGSRGRIDVQENAVAIHTHRHTHKMQNYKKT